MYWMLSDAHAQQSVHQCLVPAESMTWSMCQLAPLVTAQTAVDCWVTVTLTQTMSEVASVMMLVVKTCFTSCGMMNSISSLKNAFDSQIWCLFQNVRMVGVVHQTCQRNNGRIRLLLTWRHISPGTSVMTPWWQPPAWQLIMALGGGCGMTSPASTDIVTSNASAHSRCQRHWINTDPIWSNTQSGSEEDMARPPSFNQSTTPMQFLGEDLSNGLSTGNERERESRWWLLTCMVVMQY